MRLEQLRADLALIHLLRHQGDPSQPVTELQNLRSQWPRFAMRRRDLDQSVSRLEADGLIRVTRVGDHLWLSLIAPTTPLRTLLQRMLTNLLFLPRRIAVWMDHLGPRSLSTPVKVPRRRLVDRAESEWTVLP